MAINSSVSNLLCSALPELDDIHIAHMTAMDCINVWPCSGESSPTHLLNGLSEAYELETIDEFESYYLRLRAQALKSDANAWNELGWLWLNGFWLTKDISQALRVLRIAFGLGSIESQFNLGLLYAYEMRPANQLMAVGYLEQSFASGYLLAAFTLAELYECTGVELYSGGTTVEPDAVKAWHWYLQAAEAGHCPSQLHVGRLQLSGDGFSGDIAQGLAFLTDAAEASTNSDADEELMDYYLVTRPRNDEYFYWRDRAMLKGSSRAFKYRVYDEQLSITKADSTNDKN